MATYSGLKILGWRSSESDSACPASTSLSDGAQGRP